MTEFKYLSYEEIDQALRNGMAIEVKGSNYNPFRLIDGRVVDKHHGISPAARGILDAMIGLSEARIVEPPITRWVVVYYSNVANEINTSLVDTIHWKEDLEKHFKDEGRYIRTTTVEV